MTAFDAALGNGADPKQPPASLCLRLRTAFEMEAMDWLWPGIIACGDLTLLGGAPGMGKSQVAIYAAATVSRGGTWPDGSRAQRGSVILCETEDRPRQTLLRPGSKRREPTIAHPVRDKPYGFSASMAALAAQAERLPDLRLLVLSPVLTFFGPTSNDDNTVRAKLRPLLEWAAARSVAVLGIIHPLKDRPGRCVRGLRCVSAGMPCRLAPCARSRGRSTY